MSPENQQHLNVDELLDDIRYVSQSTKNEIQHVGNKIRQHIAKVDLPQNVLDALTDDVSMQLGQLAAKVKMTEKAIQSLESRQNPKNVMGNAESVHDNNHPTDICFSASQLNDNKNFFPTEISSNGISYSWSGTDPEIQFSFALDRGKKLEMQILLFALIKSEYSKQMKVFIDGRHIKHRFSLNGSLFVVSCILPVLGSPAQTIIKILLPGTHRPTELGSGADNRTLGIAISEIRFGKPGGNFSYLLKRLRLKK